MSPAPAAGVAELAPGVFYAPAWPAAKDVSSARNEHAGWRCEFEGFVPPPFGRAFDAGLQYAQVRVTAPRGITTHLPAWLRFTLPPNAFPEAFLRDYPVVQQTNGVPCSFPLPLVFPDGTDVDARFVTPVDLRWLMAAHQNGRLFQCCAFVLCCFPCAVLCLPCFLSSLSPPSDYGLGPRPATGGLVAGGGCSGGCGYGGGGYAGGGGCGG